MPYKPGEQIGPFDLVKLLGSGSFGSVWLAERRTRLTCTKVAIKVPHAANLDLAEVEAEARIWVRASGHPNVLPIIEADVYDDQFVIVSEYAADGTLRDFLQHRSEPLNTETALNLTVDLLRGLQFLHEQGIVHRDLKPTNILFQRDVPRITDFGISRLLDHYSSSGVAGTFAYMAPETFRGFRNEQTDIWAIGIILFELLSLKHPFSEPDIPSLIRAITSDEPIPYLPGNSSFTLQAVMRKALEKDPRKRFKSADEMLDALRSDVVRFEMILRPDTKESRAPGTDEVVFPPRDRCLDKPRIQHYSFTRDYLRNRAFAIPRSFVDDLFDHDGAGKRKLQFYWGVNARELALEGEPYIPPEGLDAFPWSEMGRFKGVVITLPQPMGFVEAFFVAVVVVYTEPPSEDECELRYFTLDLGKGEKGDVRTVLSEWGPNGHIYSEVCLLDDIYEFWDEVENRLPNYSEPVVEWDQVKYPYHREFQYTVRDGPLITDNEVNELEGLVKEFTKRGPVTCSILLNEAGFELNLYARYKITRSFGNDLFLYLAHNFFRPRDQSVSFI